MNVTRATRTVSALIVSRNVCNYLLATLRSYYATAGSDAVAVVVDNASTDGSADAVARSFPQARLVRLAENVGFGRANNAGLNLSDSEFLLILNPDVIVKPGCVATLADFLAARPDVGAAGPRLEREDGRLDLAARRAFPSPAAAFYRLSGMSRLFPHSRRFNRYNLGHVPLNTPHEIDSGTAACLMVRRAAIDQVGFFDPDYFMYGEDLDLCFRLKEHGWKIFFVPDAVAVHVKGTATRQDSGRMLREFHRAMWIFYEKHYARSTPAVAGWFVWLGIWARWLALAARARLTSSRTVSP